VTSRANAIERSQKKLYVAVKRELSHVERRREPGLLAYERAFRASLAKKPRASDRERLLAAIAHANAVLVGDFHPFRQSQKGFLRLLESAGGRTAPIVALECFYQAHQRTLDEFSAGLITVEELRDETDFDRNWTFPWENYREILVFARRAKIPLLALNVPGRRGKGPDLGARDEAAASRITDALSSHPGATVFALYGAHHLGRTHLPAALRAHLGKSLRLVVVHQNDTDLFWRAPRQKDGQRPEVLRLGPNEYCILNSVPWVKLRSYLDWLDGASSPDDEEESLDVTGIVHHYAAILAEALGLAVTSADSVELYPPDRPAPPFFRSGSRYDRDLRRHAARYQRVGYLPESAAIFLPSVSTNSLSEAASYVLRHANGPTRSPRAAEDRIAHFFFGYVGSKILNPKRKCNELDDLRRLQSTQRRSGVASKALALLRPFLREAGPAAREPRLSAADEIEACRAAGFLLGERFFSALLARPTLVKDLRTAIRSGSAKKLLRVTSRAIRKLRGPRASKQEKF